jgi:hypothetical protein
MMWSLYHGRKCPRCPLLGRIDVSYVPKSPTRIRTLSVHPVGIYLTEEPITFAVHRQYTAINFPHDVMLN